MLRYCFHSRYLVGKEKVGWGSTSKKARRTFGQKNPIPTPDKAKYYKK
jgi:hypothetical protein